MRWLSARLALVILAVLLAGAAVALISRSAVEILLGGALGAGIAVAVDGLRGLRLLRWFSRSPGQEAPRDAGLWGEIAYHAERALRERERSAQQERWRLEQFLAAIEASPNGFLLLGPNDRIEWCNAVAAQHFGLDPVRDREQRVTNLVRAPAFVHYLQQGHWDETVTVPESRGRGSLAILVRGYGEDHKLVLSQDVTARELAEAMRRDFVANVSHEIRTPLTVLTGFIETLASLPLSAVEQRRVLQLMGQQAARMQTLVGDLLTLASLEGSPRPPTDRWVAVGQLIAQAEVDARAISAGRHTLVFEADNAAQVAGDEAELASALGNLVSNAVRYTPEGGRVAVAWQVGPDGGGWLTVTDSGVGIERAHLPRLTERFYRVDGSRSRDTGGTGLGLSIVKHVVQRHGGELEIESEPGKGSLFRIRLPASRVRYLEPAPDPRATTVEAA